MWRFGGATLILFPLASTYVLALESLLYSLGLLVTAAPEDGVVFPDVDPWTNLNSESQDARGCTCGYST